MKGHLALLGSALTLLAGCPSGDVPDRPGAGDAGGLGTGGGTAHRPTGKAGRMQPRSAIPTVDLSNEIIGAKIRFDGRFDIGSFQPAPWDILYHWPDDPWSSSTTIRVDGVSCRYGQTDCSNAAMTQSPYNPDAVTDLSTWQVGNITVTQTLQITTGLSTGNPDTIKIQYNVTNNDSVPHDVGVRLLLDSEVAEQDGAMFRIPGLPSVVTTETELFPPNIPQYFQSFYDLSDRVHVAECIVGALDATLPDRLAIVSWNDFTSTTWDYTINPANDFTSGGGPDSAVAMWWNPARLEAGTSRTYITYYGLAEITGSPDLAMSAPTQLKAVETHWSPNPFTVVAYLKNNQGVPITGQSLTLRLAGAPGLALATGEIAAHPLSDLAPGDTTQTSWNVQAVAAGTWTYAASVATWPPLAVQRSIVVPPVWDCMPGTTRACVTNLPGVCAPGQQTCSDTGTWGACVQTVQSSPEVCDDGLDNDCDGLIDTADPDCWECTPGTFGTCLTASPGVCAQGQKICSATGFWGPCQQIFQPMPEVCNDGLDNDCDGLVDAADPDCWDCTPGATLGCATGRPGVCSQGKETCSATGAWGPCQQLVQPSPEVCNDGLDNDCDGLVDAADPDCWECTPGKTQGCATNKLGACARGQQTCGAKGAWGCCAQTVQPTKEDCDDGIDNDCDGLVDAADPDCWECTPGKTRDCPTDKNHCTPEEQTCSNKGVWGPCQSK